MTDILLTGLGITTVFCVVNAMYDTLAWEIAIAQNSRVNHSLRFFLRGAFFVIPAFIDWRLAIVCFSWFYLVFDPMIALMNGQGFFYLGETAYWDGFLKKNPIARFSFELIVFIYCLLEYYYQFSESLVNETIKYLSAWSLLN